MSLLSFLKRNVWHYKKELIINIFATLLAGVFVYCLTELLYLLASLILPSDASKFFKIAVGFVTLILACIPVLLIYRLLCKISKDRYVYSKVMSLPEKVSFLEERVKELSWRSAHPGDQNIVCIEGVEFCFCYCPIGTLYRQSIDGFLPNQDVHIDGFWMLKTPVTIDMWIAIRGGDKEQVMRDICSCDLYAKKQSGVDIGNYPVDNASGNECKDFIRSFQDKLRSSSSYFSDIQCSLPSLYEWVYSCRAGTNTAYPWGDNFDSAYANSQQTGSPRLIEEVEKRLPNAWGLHDMNGCVEEFADFDGQGTVCGGSSTKTDTECQSNSFRRRAYITDAKPQNQDDVVGCRFVLKLQSIIRATDD